MMFLVVNDPFEIVEKFLRKGIHLNPVLVCYHDLARNESFATEFLSNEVVISIVHFTVPER